MSYEEVVRRYLDDLHEYVHAAITTLETTPELSYRPVLDRFLRDVAVLYSEDVDVIFEPKRQGQSGRPDWRLYNKENLGLYGFVEAKALDSEHPINIEPFMNQIIKYLGIGQYVILTDGLEFIFFSPENPSITNRYSLVDKPLRGKVGRRDQINFLMDGRLREFFKESGFRYSSEEQLIHDMAIRAKGLSECVFSLSQAPLNSGFNEEENRTIEILHDVQSTLQLHHDPVLEHPDG